MTALRVRGVCVQLGGRDVVADVDLGVDAGSWVCVVGPNGAGKTTLLHAVAGMAPVTRGRVEFDGHDLPGLDARSRARLVALVPQTPVVPSGMSVFDYALLGRTPHIPYLGVESAHDIARTNEVLERLGISAFARRQVATLSGGERQRVVIARALLQEAPLLLLDEPTTALDVGHQQQVLDLVERLRREHDLAVVSTMHDLTLAGLYADELVLLDGGRVAARGTADAVLTEEHMRRHFGAQVTVLQGVHGPVVVPTRLEREVVP